MVFEIHIHVHPSNWSCLLVADGVHVDDIPVWGGYRQMRLANHILTSGNAPRRYWPLCRKGHAIAGCSAYDPSRLAGRPMTNANYFRVNAAKLD